MATLFEHVQRVPAPLPDVFAFFSHAENLGRLTPAWSGFEQLTPGPVDMREGAIIDYRIRTAGVPMTWRARIKVWDPPHRFVDEQLRGPFAAWEHTHRFVAIPGGVLIVDRVRYALPLGPLGHAADRLVVRRMLQAMFDHRSRVLADLFGAWPAPLPPTEARLEPVHQGA